ncbi:class A beta-lactamase [Gramella sp. KN1008]|uniref:class A beta-lactamase n=1 Tax=Gramella sp. KN1008 TaxID=2529298 RepID=UPI0013F14479|nr:class A beta-lactamase [Gramella sp. KN1008]
MNILLKMKTISICLLFTLMISSAFSQHELKNKFSTIADSSSGNIGVSALHIENGDWVSLNGDTHFPMQSVYKFPIAMVMLKKIDQGDFSLNDTIFIDKSEYIPKNGHSPIRNMYPDGVALTIEQILEYNVSQSDGTACDVLLRLLGGTEEVEKYIHELGVTNIAIATTEMIQVANDTIQYQNWATPEAMNKLLVILHKAEYLSKDSHSLLEKYMSFSNNWFDRRIKGLLPEGTEVIHKTGTAGTYNNLTRATNDVGIIKLPDGNHIAISVFVSDSYDSQKKREMIIAQVSKAAYDYWNK